MHIKLAALLAVTLINAPHLTAQQQSVPPMVHTPGMVHTPSMKEHVAAKPVEGGNAAFAAISEIAGILSADPATDWSKVNLEALRQHLIDMDAVTLRARVAQVPIAGGLSMTVLGDAATMNSIRRVVSAHAPMLDAMGHWRGVVTPVPGGVKFNVTASAPKDSVTIAKIRGLGFIGLLTEGAHHAEHHLMIARGMGEHSHGKE